MYTCIIGGGGGYNILARTTRLAQSTCNLNMHYCIVAIWVYFFLQDLEEKKWVYHWCTRTSIQNQCLGSSWKSTHLVAGINGSAVSLLFSRFLNFPSSPEDDVTRQVRGFIRITWYVTYATEVHVKNIHQENNSGNRYEHF